VERVAVFAELGLWYQEMKEVQTLGIFNGDPMKSWTNKST